MATVTALEAKTRLGELLSRVENGEEIIITRYDRPVARMVPERGDSLSAARQAFAEMDKLREGMRRRRMRPLSVSEILAARDQGRA
jgi:prevent-host-death family protein